MKKQQQRSFTPYQAPVKEIDERVIEIARVSRTVRGGRRIRFRAVVIVGNHQGKVGLGVGKAKEVAGAISKATSLARKKMFPVPIFNDTIPFEIKGYFGASVVLLKPAAVGSSIIAGGVVRTIADVCGIRNLVAKILGGKSKLNNAKATILAFKKLKKLVELREAKEK